MSDNRFEFLEIGDEPRISPESSATGYDSSPELSGPLKDADGEPLAAVRVTDPRGYFTFIEQSLSEEQSHSLTSSQSLQEPVLNLEIVEYFGTRGIRAGQFNFPTGIAIDTQGVLYVADSYNHRLQRITPGRDVAVIGRRGSGRGEFLSPQSVATDSLNAFYIVEQGNHRVQKYSADGVLELIFGRRGYRDGELNAPTDIVVSAAGDIYVADTGNARVQRFSRDGRFLSSIGAARGNQPALVSPQSLAMDGADNLYVADTFAHRIFRFDPAGRYVSQYGAPVRARRSEKKEMQFFREPRAVAVDDSGLIYVADSSESALIGSEAQGRLTVINSGTNQVVARIEALGRGLKTLLRPSGLAIAREGVYDALPNRIPDHLYLADTMNHRILHFAWTEH